MRDQSQEKPNGFEVTISSDLDYEELIAEIYFKEKFVAHIRKDSKSARFRIEWPPKMLPEFRCERCPLEGFLSAVELAKERLKD